MKRFMSKMAILLVACMMFMGSSVFAAQSDNARVVSAIAAYDSGLSSIAEQFLNEDAAYGKTLTASQADQMISIINGAGADYQKAMAGDKSEALYASLVSAYTRALAVANISGSVTKNGNGSITVTAYDNDTRITASFQASVVSGGAAVTGFSGVKTAGAVNYVGATAVDNTGFIVAGILGLLAVGSVAFVTYRRRSVVA